jgi:hypothetical protein
MLTVKQPQIALLRELVNDLRKTGSTRGTDAWRRVELLEAWVEEWEETLARYADMLKAGSEINMELDVTSDADTRQTLCVWQHPILMETKEFLFPWYFAKELTGMIVLWEGQQDDMMRAAEGQRGESTKTKIGKHLIEEANREKLAHARQVGEAPPADDEEDEPKPGFGV